MSTIRQRDCTTGFTGAFRLRHAVAVGLILVSAACGGGGGGGGNPVVPPPPPQPPPPGQAIGNLRGTVVGFPDENRSFLGSQVQLDAGEIATINADNAFGFQNVAPGVHRLEFTGSGHLTRRVRVDVRAGGVNHFDGIDLVMPAFNVDAYDEIYRSFSVPGTVRWVRRPRRVLLDKASLSSMPQGFSFFERHVKDAYGNWLPRFTNGFYQGTPVVTGSVAPSTPESFDCGQVTEGDIVILAVDECDQDEQFITLGTTTHCFDTQQNEVILGAIWFNPCTTEATIDHEIIHTLCASHLESQPQLSIMAPFGGPDQITGMDRLHMEYTYNRPAGTLPPDDAWSLAPLQPVIR